jgi:hypothetical protein
MSRPSGKRDCPICGKAFTPWRAKQFCSDRCRRRAENVRLGYVGRDVRGYDGIPAPTIPPKPSAALAASASTREKGRLATDPKPARPGPAPKVGIELTADEFKALGYFGVTFPAKSGRLVAGPPEVMRRARGMIRVRREIAEASS